MKRDGERAQSDRAATVAVRRVREGIRHGWALGFGGGAFSLGRPPNHGARRATRSLSGGLLAPGKAGKRGHQGCILWKK